MKNTYFLGLLKCTRLYTKQVAAEISSSAAFYRDRQNIFSRKPKPTNCAHSGCRRATDAHLPQDCLLERVKVEVTASLRPSLLFSRL